MKKERARITIYSSSKTKTLIEDKAESVGLTVSGYINQLIIADLKKG